MRILAIFNLDTTDSGVPEKEIPYKGPFGNHSAMLARVMQEVQEEDIRKWTCVSWGCRSGYRRCDFFVTPPSQEESLPCFQPS